MLHVEVNSKFFSWLRVKPSKRILLHLLIFNNNGNLRITISQQTSVIYVGTSKDHFLIVYNHQFRVNVKLFSDRYSQTGKSVLSQRINFEVIVKILNMRQFLVQWIFAPVQSKILPVKLDTHHRTGRLVSDVTFKSRQKRHHDDNLELFLFAISSINPFNELITDSVFVTDEKLILDINVMLRSANQIKVTVINRTLRHWLLQAQAPSWGASENLLLVLSF